MSTPRASDDLRALLDDWSAAVDAEFGVAQPEATEPDSWIPDRLEYAFRLGAPPLPGTDKEIVLRASEYDGTGVEWYSLDLDTTDAASVGAAADADDSVTGTRRVNLLPTPLSYPGMPANRFWEMEDAAVALGDVSAGPTDLARMLAIDFAVIYGPDWFLAPVEVPVGCVAAIDWVVVRDTFGVSTLVGTTATQAGDGVGRQFQPSVVTGEEGDNPMLVVLPSGMGTLRSDVREDVALQRDETANLAWAIERVVMGPTGRGVDRPWFQSEFDPPQAVSQDPFELVWRLSTPVAASWIPFVAGNDPDGPRRLIKARLLDTPTGEIRATVSKLLAAGRQHPRRRGDANRVAGDDDRPTRPLVRRPSVRLARPREATRPRRGLLPPHLRRRRPRLIVRLIPLAQSTGRSEKIANRYSMMADCQRPREATNGATRGVSTALRRHFLTKCSRSRASQLDRHRCPRTTRSSHLSTCPPQPPVRP